jgi:hypothetical protein
MFPLSSARPVANEYAPWMIERSCTKARDYYLFYLDDSEKPDYFIYFYAVDAEEDAECPRPSGPAGDWRVNILSNNNWLAIRLLAIRLAIRLLAIRLAVRLLHWLSVLHKKKMDTFKLQSSKSFSLSGGDEERAVLVAVGPF